jgi:hypothetical protein
MERADPNRWPWLPENPAPLEHVPRPGQWVWYVPEKIRHSSFHEVLSVETLREEGDPAIELVVVTCGRAWPHAELAAAVEWSDPVLRRVQDRVNARCPNCVLERTSGPNFWMRRLRATGVLG